MTGLALILYPGLRARAYLQRTLAEGIVCDTIVLFGQEEDDRFEPAWIGGAELGFDPRRSLREVLEERRLGYEQVGTLDLNAAESVATVTRLRPRIAIYSGGPILRAPMLAAAEHWIHVHPGWLPRHRGSTCLYYELLLQGWVSASSFFMQRQLDSGPVLVRRRFRPDPRWKAADLDHGIDAALRAEVLVETLQRVRGPGRRDSVTEDQGKSQMFYVIHPVLKHLALRELRSRPENRPETRPELQPETQSETRLETQSEIRSENRSEIRSPIPEASGEPMGPHEEDEDVHRLQRA